jgi:hypothetical protein
MKHNIVGGFARHLPALARLAIACLEGTVIPVIHQGVGVVTRLDIDRPAGTPVTAVGTAELHILLPAKALAAIAAITGGHPDLCFIHEFHFGCLAVGRTGVSIAARSCRHILVGLRCKIFCHSESLAGTGI